MVPKFSFFKKNPNVLSPTKATKGSAGYDIYIPEEVSIFPKEQKMIDTGLILSFPSTYAVQVLSRSSIAKQNKLSVYNGLIDSDFKDSVKILVRNKSNETVIIAKNSRICQFLFIKIYNNRLNEVSDFTNSGSHMGFGSTGI